MRNTLKNIEFIEGVDFNFINELGQRKNTLLIFDDSCEELSESREFTELATAGRHRGLHVIYVKHNMFHKGKQGRDAELQLTHIVLFKSPRDINQIQKLSQQLGFGSELIDWYKSATKEPHGHLMIDLAPKTVEELRISSGFNPTKFYLPRAKARVTPIDDETTNDQYAQALLESRQLSIQA